MRYVDIVGVILVDWVFVLPVAWDVVFVDCVDSGMTRVFWGYDVMLAFDFVFVVLSWGGNEMG
jgi:hypothetical protein